MSLSEKLEIEADSFAGRVGYAVSNLATRESLFRNADAPFPTASTIKLPILTAFHAFVDDGNARWDDMVRIDSRDVAGGSGIVQHLDLPRELSYRDAAWLMICLSDNTATNVLLRALTLNGANAWMTRLIGDEIRVNKFAGYTVGAPVHSMGQATPRALGRYLNDLADNRLPGAAATRATATAQIYRDTIPRYLPLDAFAPGALTIANKTGGLPGIRADIAVLEKDGRVVTVAFMTADAVDDTDRFDNEGKECIGRMARLVYDAWLA